MKRAKIAARANQIQSEVYVQPRDIFSCMVMKRVMSVKVKQRLSAYHVRRSFSNSPRPARFPMPAAICRAERALSEKGGWLAVVVREQPKTRQGIAV